MQIPQTQTVALVSELGGKVEFDDNYPVPVPGQNEVLAKVLYTGVCQSDLHTKNGTAAGADGNPITNIKRPHVGGHEGVGRIVALGPGCGPDLKVGGLVGIRFASRVCRRCEFCLAGTEQYCIKSTNHLHHEDGSFQMYIALDADYLTILPDDIDPQVIGPVLCAGVTAYKAVLNANTRAGNWLVVVGAGGGLGHLAVQYAKAHGALVIGVDAGDKRDFVLGLGAVEFIDFKSTDPVQRVHEITGLGAHAVVVTAGNAKAFAHACDMLRVGGTLSCVGIPPGRPVLETPICTIVIKGLRITGNLVGSLKECMEAVELVRRGMVKPEIREGSSSKLQKILKTIIYPRGFAKFLLVLLVLSGIGVNCIAIYSGALSAQLFAKPFAKLPRVVWSFLVFVCILLLGIAGRDHLLDVLENFLSLLGYWNTSFFVILFTEHYLFRGGSLSNYDLDAWNTPSRMPVGYAGLTAFLCGAAGWIVGMVETYYVGAIAKMIGQDGGDVANELAFVFTSVTYIPLRKLELKYVGR